jgi:hypothetical protein
LIFFLKFLKIGQNAFEEKVGISRGYISNNKGSIGTDILLKISTAYPELNLYWLIKGEGEMIQINNVGYNSSIVRLSNDNVITNGYGNKFDKIIEQNTEIINQIKNIAEYLIKYNQTKKAIA